MIEARVSSGWLVLVAVGLAMVTFAMFGPPASASRPSGAGQHGKVVHASPTVTIADPQEGFATNAGSLPVTVDVPGARTGDTVSLFVNGSEVAVWSVPKHAASSGHVFAVDVSSLDEGALSLAAVLTERSQTILSTVVVGVLDRTSPGTVADVTPLLPTGQNGWYAAGPVRIALQAVDSGDDPSGLSQTCYQLDASPSACAAASSGSPTVVSIDEDGAHVLTYWSVDNAGNVESDHPLVIKVDATVPTITPAVTPLTPVIAGSDWFNALTVHFNCADGTSGVAFCTNDVAVPEGADRSVSGLAVDNAGNASSTTIAGLNVDRTRPTIVSSVVSQSDGTAATAHDGWYDVPISVRFSCSDALSGVYSCTPARDLDDGTNQTVTGQAVDNAGNTASTTAGPLEVDTVPPTLTATLAPADPDGENGWYRGVTVHYACGDAMSGVAVCPPDQTLGDGSDQPVSAAAVDVAGNVTSLALPPIDVDGTAPTTVAEPASGAISGTPGVVTLTATDATSGVAQTCYVLDGGTQTCVAADSPVSVPIQEVGLHTLTFWSTDQAGNTEASHTLPVILDDTEPTSTVDVPASGWYAGSSVAVQVTGTDAGSGVAEICYTVDTASETCTSAGPAESELDVNVAVVGVGVHTLHYYAVDAAGNTEATHTAEFGLDATAPTTVSDAPGGAVSGPVTVNLLASDADSGVDQTCYTLDGADEVCASLPVSVTVSDEGDHTLTFHSVDVAGNVESSQTVHIQIDDTEPTSTVDVPASGWYAGSSVTVQVTGTDSGSGVAEICYTVDAASKTCTSAGPAEPELDVNVAVVGVGVHTLHYYAVDAAGNTEATHTAEFGLDATAPTTDSDAPSGAVSGPVTVNLTASDADSGVDQTCYTLDGADEVCASLPVSVTVSDEGDHTLTFHSVDVAGNVESSQTVHFQIDNP